MRLTITSEHGPLATLEHRPPECAYVVEVAPHYEAQVRTWLSGTAGAHRWEFDFLGRLCEHIELGCPHQHAVLTGAPEVGRTLKLNQEA